MYHFMQFDPQGEGEIDGAIFAPSASVWGINVKVPALAEQCAVNIDSYPDTDLSAIKKSARSRRLPSPGAILVTVQPDLDSIGAMAVFAIRARGEDITRAIKRIDAIATASKFVHGDWPGPRSLFCNSMWDEGESILAPISAAMMNSCLSMKEKVSMMETWLMTGCEPEGYWSRVEAKRADLIRSLKDGRIKTAMSSKGRVVAVESSHQGAVEIGYRIAPVVVLDSEFRFHGGDPHRKVAIYAYGEQYADIESALAVLSALESGWSGSSTRGESPQGVSTILPIEKIVEVVERHTKCWQAPMT